MGVWDRKFDREVPLVEDHKFDREDPLVEDHKFDWEDQLVEDHKFDWEDQLVEVPSDEDRKFLLVEDHRFRREVVEDQNIAVGGDHRGDLCAVHEVVGTVCRKGAVCHNPGGGV